MKAKFYILIAIIFSTAVALVSCKKEDPVPPQSKAEFGASKTTAMVNEEIQFTNSSENATAFKWSFGDGTTSTEVAPKKSYSDVGIYLVSLVSTGAGGSTIQNITITIVPHVGFNVENADNLYAHSEIQFINTSIGATSYLWEFGDAANSTSEEENPTFSYTQEGNYTVTLTAISDEGESTISKEISITSTEDVVEMYYIDTDSETLRKIALDGSGTVSTFLDLAGMYGVGLAFDEENEVIYFSDYYDASTPNGRIWKVNIDGTELQEIASGILDPYGIAIDKQNQKIYWVDDNGNVSRVNSDGTGLEIGVVNIPGGGLRAIDLDVANNKMYFYEVMDENLYVANLDGSNVEIVLSDIYGYGLKVDTQNGKLFFDDQNSKTFVRTNLDGSDMIVIEEFTTGTRVHGIEIDYEEGLVYWSSRGTETISKANLDGTGVEVVAEGLGDPRGIFLKK